MDGSARSNFVLPGCPLARAVTLNAPLGLSTTTRCPSHIYPHPCLPYHAMDVYEFITPDPPAGSVTAGTFLAQHTTTGHAVAIRKFPRAAIKYAQREVFLLHFWAERVRQRASTAAGSALHSNVGNGSSSAPCLRQPATCSTQAQAQAQLSAKVPCIQHDHVCPEFGEWFTTRNSIWAVMSWVDGVTVAECCPAATSWRVPSMPGVTREARVIAASMAHACSLMHTAGVVLASSIAPWNIMISSAGFPFVRAAATLPASYLALHLASPCLPPCPFRSWI